MAKEKLSHQWKVLLTEKIREKANLNSIKRNQMLKTAIMIWWTTIHSGFIR